MGSYSIRDMSFVKQLDRARKDLDAIKTKQPVSRRVLATKKTISQNVKSILADVGFPPGTTFAQIIYLRVKFEADTQISPFGRLALEFYDLSGNRLSSDSGIVVFYINDIVTQVNDGTLEWNLDVRCSGAGTIGSAQYSCKLIVYATDTGAISYRNAWEAA